MSRAIVQSVYAYIRDHFPAVHVHIYTYVCVGLLFHPGDARGADAAVIETRRKIAEMSGVDVANGPYSRASARARRCEIAKISGSENEEREARTRKNKWDTLSTGVINPLKERQEARCAKDMRITSDRKSFSRIEWENRAFPDMVTVD